MRQSKVSTSFSRFSQTGFLQKAQHISQCLTGNSTFPAPVPDLKTVVAAISAYAMALANVSTKENTIVKKQLRTALTNLLNQLALYVQVTSNGDPAAIATSGYSLTRNPQPVGVLAKPENFRAVPVYNNAIRLSLKKIFGADNYLYEYTAAPLDKDAVWTAVNCSKSKTIISGLSKGIEYAFRVSGIGTNPAVVYSDVVTSYVL